MPTAVKRTAKAAVAASPRAMATFSTLAPKAAVKSAASTTLPLGGNAQVHRENVVVCDVSTGDSKVVQGMVISFTNGPGVWQIQRSTDLTNWMWGATLSPWPWLLDLTDDPYAFFLLTPVR